MDDGYASRGDLRLYYQVHGDDSGLPPLLLIHGGGATIETNWAALLPALSATRRVIAYEEEGHGRTAPVERDRDPGVFADDAAAVLDLLGLGTVDVLAFSAGCQTALALALSHPERIRRLVLASAPWRRDALVDGFWPSLESATLATMPPLYTDAHRRLNDDPERLQRFFEIDRQRMLGFADWPDETIAAIAAPTLVIATDRDVVTVESALRLSRTVMDGRLLVVPGNHGDYLGEAMAAGGDSRVMEATLPFVTGFLDAR